MATNAATLPFREQIDLFRKKVSIPTKAWTDVWREAHNTSFMVAGAYKADLLDDLHQAVDKAIAEGTTLREFRRDFDQTVQRRGWDYKGSRGWRTRVIYETNLRTSYAAGRHHQLTSPEMLRRRPYWVYEHSPASVHPRPMHLSWSGTVLPASDPWWQAHATPNGWGCKCTYRALSERQAKARGVDKAPDDGIREWTAPDGSKHEIPNGIDPGWDYAPGSVPLDEHARKVIRKAADKLPAPLKTMLAGDLDMTPPKLDDFIARGKAATEALSKGIDPGDPESMGELRDRLLAEIGRRGGRLEEVVATGPAARAIEKASTVYPDAWTRAADALGRLEARWAPESGRLSDGWAYAADRDGLVNLSAPFGPTSTMAGDGWLVIPRDRPAVAVHELGHRLQAAMPELQAYFEELHIRRTTTDGVRDALEQLPVALGYEPGEVAREDRYVDAYFGREYDARYRLAEGPSEVLAMTYQYLLGGSRAALWNILTDDPELVHLAVGLLLHFRA